MAVISLGTTADKVWLVARWAFKRVLQNAITANPSDAELVAEFRQALALDGLHLDLMESALSRRVISALRDTIQSALQDNQMTDNALKDGLDEESHTQYANALSELLLLLDQCE